MGGLGFELFGMISECAVPSPLLVVVRVGVSRETWRVAVGVVKRGAMFHVKRKFGGCAMWEWFHVKHGLVNTPGSGSEVVKTKAVRAC